MNKLNQARMRSIQTDLASCGVVVDDLVNSINHGLDLTKRISSQYKMQDKLPEEVIDYICEYEAICKEYQCDCVHIDRSEEWIGTAYEVVKTVVYELWRLLCKLYDAVMHCLRWIFSAQYRAATQAVKYRQRIAMMRASMDSVQKFESFNAETISPEDFQLICSSTNNITKLILQINDVASAAAADNIMTTQASLCGFKFSDNQLDDVLIKVKLNSGSYKTLGWLAPVCDVSARMYIDCTGNIVKLKKMASKLETTIADLKRKMNKQIANGADESDLSKVQAELTVKTKVLQITKNALEVVSDRLTFMDRIMGKIAHDADCIANGKDPSDAVEDYGW